LYKGKGHIVEKMDFTEFNNPVHTVLADNEFESLREKIEECGMQINVTAKEEHVLEVERQIRIGSLKREREQLFRHYLIRAFPRR